MRKTKHIITILILLIILLSFSYKVIASPTLNEETITLEGQTLTDVNDLYNQVKDYKDNTNLSESFRSQLKTDFTTLSNAKTLKAINKTAQTRTLICVCSKYIFSILRTSLKLE